MHKILTQTIQSKFNYYFQKLHINLTKPESRFLHETVLGILKSQSVILNQISIHINDKISLKKTTERLRRHMNKKGFWKKLIIGHIKTVSGKIQSHGFAILDLSDIQKKYSKMMEGLERVKDGSNKKSIGLGYWLMNIIYISSKDDNIIPLYNKLYSFSKGTLSENKEILKGIFSVIRNVKQPLTWVIDRGGDRSQIIIPLIRNNLNFIIRSVGSRHMEFQCNAISVRKIGRKIKMKHDFSIQKMNKNKPQKVKYSGGAVKVRFINQETKSVFTKQLWIVTLKGEGKGYSWYIVSSDEETEYEVVSQVLTGYGYRWKIEEYHRHIKQQFNLEDIQLRKFQGLQTMMSLLTIAMFLIYSQIKSIHMKLLINTPIKTIYKNKLFEIMGFIYYKIGTIVKILMTNVTARTFLPDILMTTHYNSRQTKLQLV